jgi:hypothetical protein
LECGRSFFVEDETFVERLSGLVGWWVDLVDCLPRWWLRTGWSCVCERSG